MSNKIERRELLRAMSAAAVCALLSRVASAAARSTAPASVPRKIRIANATGGLNLTMGELMRRQRYLEEFGLAPELLGVADGTRILGGLVSGSVDVSTMSGFGQVFPAIERGAPIKIIAGGALLPGLALYSAKPRITALQHLAGKIIGTGSIGALVHQLTVTLLQKHRVEIAAIRFVNVGSSADILRAVAAGTVDAGASDAALIATAAEHGVHPIEQGNMTVELPDYTYQGAWTTDRVIATQRESLVRTLAAYARLYRFVQSAAAESAFLQARHTVFPRASASDHRAQWNYIQQHKPFAVALRLSPERLRYMQQINLNFKVQKSLLPFERVADMSIAADALQRLSDPPSI